MNISFKWIGGATWILNVDTIKIACDPVLCSEGHIQDYRYFKTKRINNPVYDDSDFENVTVWLLTHNHEDHIDKYGLVKIHKESTIVSHDSIKPLFKKEKYNDIRFLASDEETELLIDATSIKIKAVPAIHAKKSLFSRIIGNGNGYLLEIKKNNSKYSIYVTGDSVYNKSISRHIGISNIDLIIANSGSAIVKKVFLSFIIGRITNNIKDLIKMNVEMKPGILIPVHWGTFTHYSEKITPESFNKYSNIKILNAGEKILLS